MRLKMSAGWGSCLFGLLAAVGFVLASGNSDSAPDTGQAKPAEAPGPAREPGELRRWTLREEVLSVAVAPDGRTVLAGSTDGLARLWDLETGKELRHLRGPGPMAAGVGFSGDGRRLWVRDVSSVCIFDTATGKTVRCLKGQDGSAVRATLSRDGGRMLTGSRDGTLREWSVADGRMTAELEGHEDSIVGLFFLAGEQQVLTVSTDGTARTWALGARKELKRFPVEAGAGAFATLSPSGEHLAVYGGRLGGCCIWNVDAGKKTGCLKADQLWINSFAFTPTRDRFITAGATDGTVRVWDSLQGTERHRFTGAGKLHTVAVSQDGQYAVTGSEKGAVVVWRLPPD